MINYRFGLKDAVHFTFITFALVMFGLLAGKYYLKGQAGELNIRPVRLAGLTSRSDWYGVYFQDRKIGYSNFTVEPQDSLLVLTDRTFLSFTMIGQPQKVDTYLRAVTDDSLALVSFVFSLRGEDTRFGLRGRVEDDELVLSITTAGETRIERIGLEEPPHLPGTVQLLLADLQLEAGKRFSIQVFDPASLANMPLEIEVAGRDTIEHGGLSVPVWHMRQNMAGMLVDTYLDDTGRTIEERSRIGYRLVLETEEEARAGSRSGQAADLNQLVSIAVDRPLPSPRTISRLTVQFEGLDGDTLGLSGGVQSYRDGVLEIVAAALPPEGSELDTVPTAILEDFTTPSLFVQSEHPRLLALAAGIVNLNDGPVEKVRSIVGWLGANITKKPTFSIPNTLEVMERRSGDCNEFAVLFCSLARAAGIPARIAMGLVYLEGAFYYHAWDECFIDGFWVPVDPVFGQFPADATHLRMIAGDMDRQVEILPLVGSLGISVIDWEQAPGAF
ncbi:MAG: transglutaminase-like domain-containing protein [Gemmatimonadota bacterium]|nr:transglutaminase-like domain-containing protein [Gemmatimonadota bacterium]